MSALKGWVTGPLAAIVIAASVAACASPQPAAPAVSDAAPVSSQPARAALGVPLRLPGLNELTGLQPAEIVKILGQPDLRREEPPASLWQYRAADCVLNLFFYREPGGERLVHIETWQRNLTGGPTPARCRDENAPLRAHLVSLRSTL